MLILNFTHPLTPDQRAQIESLLIPSIEGRSHDTGTN